MSDTSRVGRSQARRPDDSGPNPDGGGTQQFSAGSDRVDSAARVSVERQRIVEQASTVYLADRPGVAVISVRAVDEAPQRSAALAVVNDNGESRNLAITVQLKRGKWTVTDALALNMDDSR
ncbi:MAG: hypothetical protein HQ526_01280 [Actinobacteria bacterium]|nr:hypothetical protein [Actinomycetota bacterium]